jgi:hypothetical protein
VKSTDAVPQLEKHQDALADTEASLAIVKSFKALRTRARIHLHLEELDAAVGDFRSAIQQAEIEGSDADVRSLRVELKKAEAALKRSKTKDYYKILGQFSVSCYHFVLNVVRRSRQGVLGDGHQKGVQKGKSETPPRQGSSPNTLPPIVF